MYSRSGEEIMILPQGIIIWYDLEVLQATLRRNQERISKQKKIFI